MFLFEGNFGSILHTGDCRLTPECLQSLPDKYIAKTGKRPRCSLDCIFLDCTFAQFPSSMPSRHIAIRQVINCIWKHPDAPTVYLTCDLLGQERILVEVSQTFGEKIYVDKGKNLELFKSLQLLVPDIISEDPSSRFQLLDGFPRLYERAEAMIAKARAEFHREPLIIRASSQWYAYDDGVSDTEKRKKKRFDEAVRDVYGVWHVCYSIHSSRDELEEALKLLQPKWVVSTTPPCRATDLSYVKKHCLSNNKACRDSLQKLLNMSPPGSIHTDNLAKSCTDEVENIPEILAEPIVISPFPRKRLSVSPPSRRPMITLFGRARLGPLDYCVPLELKEVSPALANALEKAPIDTCASCQEEDAKKLKSEVSPDLVSNAVEKAPIDDTYASCQKEDAKKMKSEEILEPQRNDNLAEPEYCFTKTANICWTNAHNENLRKVYRSMNAPIPQRLPSLVGILGAKISEKKRL